MSTGSVRPCQYWSRPVLKRSLRAYCKSSSSCTSTSACMAGRVQYKNNISSIGFIGMIHISLPLFSTTTCCHSLAIFADWICYNYGAQVAKLSPLRALKERRVDVSLALAVNQPISASKSLAVRVVISPRVGLTNFAQMGTVLIFSTACSRPRPRQASRVLAGNPYLVTH